MTDADALLMARAYALASRAHADQTRKGEAGIPYINHCCEVAELVAEAGAPVAVVVAAVLHDVVEDSETTVAEIGMRFGAEVAAMVGGMTDPPERDALPRGEKKARQAEHMATAPDEVRTIKIADQTSNVRDIVREPGAWEAADAADYVAGAERVVAACRGAAPELERVFDAAVAEAMMKIGGPR
jgi:guanosine-3',5'-bis(diphosphate) 3'-pyrophosphohydrolase